MSMKEGSLSSRPDQFFDGIVANNLRGKAVQVVGGRFDDCAISHRETESGAIFADLLCANHLGEPQHSAESVRRSVKKEIAFRAIGMVDHEVISVPLKCPRRSAIILPKMLGKRKCVVASSEKTNGP